MIQEKNRLSVRRQCELIGVNRSGLYSKPKATDKAAKALREEIMGRIDYWHTQMPAIGSRKLTVLLQQEGYRVGRKYVRRCMEQMVILRSIQRLICPNATSGRQLCHIY